MKNKSLFLFLFIVSFFSCGNDLTKEKNKEIIGTWSVYDSQMNNKTNDLMKSAYFEFKEGNTLMSNLFDEGMSHKYTLKEDLLTIDTPEPINFKIVQFEGDTLILETRIKVFRIKYSMVKQGVQKISEL